MSGQRLAREDPAGTFLDLYDRALPQVYGYLLSRCGQRAVAEDLTDDEGIRFSLGEFPQ